MNDMESHMNELKLMKDRSHQMICEKCVNFEVFGKRGSDEWFDRCALLDIWNMEEGDQCEFFSAVPDPPPPSVITSEPELTMFF